MVQKRQFITTSVADSSAKQSAVHEVTPLSDYVWVSSNGSCLYEPRFELAAAQCDVNVAWFPFDVQTCDIILESWTLNKYQLNVTLVPDADLLSLYIPSTAWNLSRACN